MSELSAAASLATLSDVPGTELRQLQVTFDSFRDFVESYAPWLSDTCIFVETHENVAVGTPVRLEIWLRGRPVLIRALGHVDWVRDATDPDEEGPPGVALEITYLDPASARLIDSIFRLYRVQDETPLDDSRVETWEHDVEPLDDGASSEAGFLSPAPPDESASSAFGFGLVEPLAEEAPPGAGAAVPDPLPEPSSLPVEPPAEPARPVLGPLGATGKPGVSVAMSASDTSFLRRSVVMFLLAVAVGAALFAVLRRGSVEPAVGGGEIGSTEPVVTEPGGAAVEPSPPEPVPAGASETPAPAAAGVDAEHIVRDVEGVVRSWAAAWSEQNPDGYLAAYAPGYSPPELSRGAWEQERRGRITAPARIVVEVEELDVRVIGGSRAVARFYQDYETDTSHLYTWKTLELERVGDGWRIVAERAGR